MYKERYKERYIRLNELPVGRIKPEPSMPAPGSTSQTWRHLC